MRKEPMHKMKQYIRQKRRHRGWNRIVAGLACVVVFTTTYMLILPAITMEQTTYCGIEAHTHEETCFEKQLVCAVEEAAPHIHSESCYQEEQVLICGLTESEGAHSHESACYETESVLACGQEENAEGHVHTEACYEEEQVLVCGKEESAGHTHGADCVRQDSVLICSEEHEHTDGCYQTEDTYICGLTEGEGAHTHGPECYQTQKTLICGQSEGQTHVHTDTCYEEILTCQKEEHEHSLACFSDPNADVETQDAWERTMADVQLTGIWADDVIAIAKSQLGYEESTKNYTVTDDGTVKGYSRYGAWYGDPYGDWCAMFVSFCLHYAGVDADSMPIEASCPKWIELLDSEKYALYHPADGSYTPHVGDLIFFDLDEYTEETKNAKNADHVGFVCELEYDEAGALTEIKTIEGNSSDRVQYESYTPNDTRILGYGEMPENPVPQSGESPAPDSIALIPMTASEGNLEIPNTTSVTVRKKWKGGSAARPDSVVIHLYQNGLAYGDPIILNADNKWTYQVENLPYCSDAGIAYEYTISEDEVKDFYTAYSDRATIPDSSSGTHYLNRGTLTDGATFVMVTQDVVITAVADKDGKAKFSGNPTVTSDAAVTYDGTTYQGEITEDVPEGNRWTIQQNTDGTYILKCGEYTLFHKEDGTPYLATSPSDNKSSASYYINQQGQIYCTKKDGKYTYVKADIDKKKGTFKNIGKADKASDAASFTFYEEVYVVGAHERYEYTVTNSYISSGGDSGNVVISGNKSIDYLGDGGSNPDTELTGEEFYRQYLSLQGKGEVAVDFLFVVDNTGSMTSTFGTFDGEKLSRDKTVSKILNGSYNGNATEDGLITQVLRANPENHAAVITFCGMGTGGSYNDGLANKEVITQLEWTALGDNSVAPYADVLHRTGGGTCYEAGILRAEEMLQNEEIKDNGHPKVIVFLGDGEPNGYLQNSSGEAASAEELADKDSVTYNWRGSSKSYQGTRNATDYLVNNVDAKIYSISVGYDVSGDADVLGYMAEKGGGEKYVAYDTSQAVEAFRQIISNYYPSHVSLTDNLSQYVELYTDRLDFKITREAGNQNTVIWSGELNSNGTIGSTQNGGASYIQSVSYVKGGASDSTGKMVVTFQPSYILESGVKYEVSYNLKVTDTAKTAYAEGNYNATGDAGTDYGTNETSSGKAGFHSNQSANITYAEGGGESIKLYPHPVIQVPSDEPEPTTTTLTINKTVLGAVTDEKFTFKAVLSDGAFPEPDENDTYTIDENGAAIFQLGDKDSITLTVPLNAAVTITETSHDGYYTIFKNGQVTVSSSDTANVTIGNDPVVIDVTNSAGTELPATGGSGTSLFTLCGLGLMSIAGTLMYRYHVRRRRERRAEQS